jgi:hypothetical protein
MEFVHDCEALVLSELFVPNIEIIMRKLLFKGSDEEKLILLPNPIGDFPCSTK